MTSTDLTKDPDTLEGFLLDTLATVTTSPEKASSDELAAMWAQLFPGEDGATRTGLRAFQDVVRGVADSAGAEALNLDSGGWEVDLSAGVVRSALATAALAGILAASGVTGLLPLVAPAVLPLLFDVRRVRLTKSENIILAELRLSPEATADGLTADELYAKLSPETQQQLSKLDFADFLDQVRRAGLADPAADGRLILRQPDKARLRISIS